MPNVDPITTVYQAIRAALKAWEPLTGGSPALVKPGNFPDLSDPKFQNMRGNLAPNDTPELVLTQGAFQFLPIGRNSTIVNAVQSFPLAMTQDHAQLARANQVKWEVFRGLLNAGETINLTPFVRTWDIGPGNDAPFGIEPWSRGAVRFVSVLQVNVQFDFPQSRILAL